MNHVLEVIVYGGGGIFKEYFDAIVATVGTDIFKTLLRITILLAATTALFSAITRRDFLVCVRWFAIYYLVFYIIFIPKVDVMIIDRTEGDLHYRADNVPLGLGVLAHVTTTAGDALTQLTDKIFSMPDNLRYSKTGMVMASKIVLASRQFQITDSVLNENMRQFVTHCVFWDILLNRYTLDDLTTAPNIWEFVKDRASPARACLYNDGSKTQVTVCSKVAGPLGKALADNMEKVAAYHGSRIFSNAKDTITAKNLLMTYLPISYGYLLKTSSSATDILQQSVMANAIMDGTLHFGIGANSQTAVASYTAARAQEQQRLTQNTLGFLAGYWLPIMKNAFEAIMYGCFIFVMLLSIFPFGLEILKNYVFTLCWLQSWAPLYAIINLICTYYAQVQSVGNTQNGFVLRDLSGLMQANHDMASLAGYLTLSVPFIAAGLVKGMAGTMTHVAQYMGGVSQSAGSQAASEAVAGNISMGVTGMRNNSAFNISAHQQDLTARMSSGMSYQLPGGESINFMPDGGIAVSRGNTISDLGVNVNLAKSIQSSAMQQADYAYSAAKGEVVASGENYQAGMRSLYELAEHAGSSKSSGDAWIVSENTSAVQALNKTRDLTQQFADEHQISYDHAKEILTTVHSRFSGSIGGSFGTPDKGGASIGVPSGGSLDTAPPGGIGASIKTPGAFSFRLSGEGGIGIDGSTGHKDSDSERRAYREAEDFIKKSGYSESVDIVSRAAIDHSFHSNNEKGARVLDSMGSSFDRSNSLRKDADAHFQQAASYRNVASHAEENAVQTNVNASQAFLNYIANHPGPSGHGRMGVTNAIAALRDPENTKLFAEHFARDYANRNLSNLGQGVPHSHKEVSQIHQNNAEAISTQANLDLQKHQVANKEQMAISAKERGSLSENLVDTSVKRLAESKFEANKQLLQQQKDQLSNVELNKEQNFKIAETQEKQEKGYGTLRDHFDRRNEIRKNIDDKLDNEK